MVQVYSGGSTKHVRHRSVAQETYFSSLFHHFLHDLTRLGWTRRPKNTMQTSGIPKMERRYTWNAMMDVVSLCRIPTKNMKDKLIGDVTVN